MTNEERSIEPTELVPTIAELPADEDSVEQDPEPLTTEDVDQQSRRRPLQH